MELILTGMEIEKSIRKKFEQKIAAVDGLMKKELEKTGCLTLQKAAGRLISAGGKRLRPLLFLLFYQQSAENDRKIDCQEAYQLAAALELLHLASLIHDDLIDDSPRRRGKITIHEELDVDRAIYIGDILLSFSFSIAGKILTGRLLEKFNKVHNLMGIAELRQYENRYNLELTIRDYLKRIRRKTALFFAFCAEAGAELAGVEPSRIKYYYNFGIKTGMAFQIRDDLQDFSPEEDNLISEGGDPSLASDIQAGIITLPLLYLLKRSRAKGREPHILQELFGLVQQQEELKKKVVVQTGKREQATEKTIQKIKLKKINVQKKRLIKQLVVEIKQSSSYEHSRRLLQKYLAQAGYFLNLVLPAGTSVKEEMLFLLQKLFAFQIGEQ